jgi:hypothetical protein
MFNLDPSNRRLVKELLDAGADLYAAFRYTLLKLSPGQKEAMEDYAAASNAVFGEMTRAHVREFCLDREYTPGCYALASMFLEDEPCSDDPEQFDQHREALANWIQAAVNQWFLTPDGVEYKDVVLPQPLIDGIRAGRQPVL